VKIWQGVASKQPNKPMPRIKSLQFTNRFNGIMATLPQFEVADPDSGTARFPLRRGEAEFEGRHVPGPFLERVAWRDQPPDFIQSEHLQGFKGYMPMPVVRRIERSSKKADARHTLQLAWPKKAA
jgi:hypothetical protein